MLRLGGGEEEKEKAMEPYRIRTIDKIAAEGLALLDDRFLVSTAEPAPHGIIVRSSRVATGDHDGLLAVARAGAGVNNITVKEATEQGICVFNTPGANANAVAELVFVMLGLWVRNIHQAIDFCDGLTGFGDEELSRRVESGKSSFRGVELAGKTLGVLGLGKIGVRVANMGIRNTMRVVGFDPFPSFENIHQLSPEVIMARSLEDMVSQADILSLHIPLSNKTRGMCNGDFLARMKPAATLVNYARGPIVVDEEVRAALDSGRLAGYITDFPSSALVSHPKVLATPHLGASTEESEENCATMAARELRDYLLYGTVSRSVNFPTAESIPADSCHSRFIMINRDIPDMIGFASHTIGSHGINIASYLNESNGAIGYNIIDLESPIPSEVVAEIEAHPGVIRTRVISCRG